METIRTAIRDRIRARDLEPAAVAQRAGMTPGQLERSLNGARKITGAELIGLCQVLGLDLSDLRGQSVPPVYDTDNGHDLYRVINKAGHTLAEFEEEQPAIDYFYDVTGTEEPAEEGDPLYPWAIIDPAGRIIENY